MKVKKIISLILLFLFASMLIFRVYATDNNAVSSNEIYGTELIYDNNTSAVEIDLTAIPSNFNNSRYVSEIRNLGISINAVAGKNNSIILTYNDTSLEYTYNSETKIYTTHFPKGNSETYNILNAIFVDCISTMQGNPEGSQIAFALDDSFCYSSLKANGIAKNYYMIDDVTCANFDINPFFKMSIPVQNEALEESNFLIVSPDFYSDTADCLTRNQDIIFYKDVAESGNIEFYIGSPNELTNYSYQTLLNSIATFFKDNRASYYIKQNYSDFSKGNAEFDGVSIDTSITSLPISTVDTVLLPQNMKYVKISFDRKVVTSKLASVNTNSSAQLGNSTKSNAFSAILIITLIIAILLVIIVIIKKHNS